MRHVDKGAAKRRLAAIGSHFAAEQGGELDDRDAVQSTSAAADDDSLSRGRHLAGPDRLGWPAPSPRRPYLLLAALVAGIAVLVSVWVVIRSTSRPSEMTLTTEHVGGSGPAAGVPSPAGSQGLPPAAVAAPATAGVATAAPTVVVDVTGKVRKPGIVELPVGSRVVDALKAAGGARQGVDLSSVNLARVLVDGEQIVIGDQVPAVPGSSPPASAGATTGGPQPIDLNTATEIQLEALPDIGPVTAAAIIQYRSDHGPFGSVDELLDVSGIGDATMADIRPYVFV